MRGLGDGGEPVDCGLQQLAELLWMLCGQAEAAPPGVEQQQAAVAAAAIVAPCAVPPHPGLADYELIDHYGRAARQLAETARQLAAAAAAAQRKQGSASSAEPTQPAAAAAADPELAVRRARALALRSCANPRCSNLGGASTRSLKGGKCGGCRMVRYCSDACCRADWQAHRRACKLLQRELGSGG